MMGDKGRFMGLALGQGYRDDDEFFNRHDLTEEQQHLYKMGDAARGEGELTIALTHYQALLRGRPDLVLVWIFRGVVEMFLDQHDKAYESMSEAVRLSPDEWQPWGARVEVLVTIGRKDLWRRHCEEFLERHPTNTEATFYFAETSFGRFEDYLLTVGLCDGVLANDERHSEAKGLRRKAMRKVKKLGLEAKPPFPQGL